MKKTKINIFTMVVVLLSIWILTGVGCGGSSGDNDNADNTGTGSGSGNGGGEVNEAAINKTIDATINSLSQSADKGDAYTAMDDILSYTSVGGIASLSRAVIALDPIEGSFPCGSYTLADNMYTYSFNGTCDGLSGSITISFSTPSGEDDQTTIYTITYDNFTAYDACTIDGTVTYTIDLSGDTYSYSYTFVNLSICGDTRDGSYTISSDGSGIVYELGSETYTYSGTVNVWTDMDYSPVTGLSGHAEVTLDGEVYTVTVSNIMVDNSCGIPTSGTIEIMSPDETVSITVDFSSTNCDSAVVTYSFNGEQVTYEVNLG
jgi:hypothetical protein